MRPQTPVPDHGRTADRRLMPACHFMPNLMHYAPWLLLAAALAVGLFLRHAGRVSVQAAAGYLQQGAPLIDVRSLAEFNQGHVEQALNLPLDELTTAVSRRWPDQQQVLILHCASGVRSGIARRKLQRLGYVHAFNLGSWREAQALAARLKAQKPPPPASAAARLPDRSSSIPPAS